MLEATSNTSKSLNFTETLLEVDFEPSPYSVICGRGKICFDAIGNRRLKVTASLFLQQYSEGNKDQKSMILSTVIAITRDACPQGRGAFIKFVDGRWWEVDTRSAREKVGCVFRDCLHEKYRSSSKSKIAKRKYFHHDHDTAMATEDFQTPTQVLSGFDAVDAVDALHFLMEDELPLLLPLIEEEIDTQKCMTSLVGASSNASLISLDEMISPLHDDDDFSQIGEE